MATRKKRKKQIQTISSKEILTNEDWHPTKDGKVRVKLIKYPGGMWRVCVWGGDDFGMEFDTFDAPKARRVFDRIVHLTTKADLRSLGLRPA